MGRFCLRLSWIIALTGWAIGCYMSIIVILRDAGAVAALISLAILPLTLFLLPWYEFIKNSNWEPVLIVYGSSICAFFFYFFGKVSEEF